jgi:hypothetical protein
MLELAELLPMFQFEPERIAGHAAYLDAVDQNFGIDIDYAMLIKHYGESADQGHERKYSPSVCTGTASRSPGSLTLGMCRPDKLKGSIFQ